MYLQVKNLSHKPGSSTETALEKIVHVSLSVQQTANCIIFHSKRYSTIIVFFYSSHTDNNRLCLINVDKLMRGNARKYFHNDT